MTLEEVRQPIRDEYNAFCQEYARRTSSSVPLLNEVEAYLAATPGKRLRPLLVMLSAKLFPSFADRRRTLLTASAVEMLHNATLMHDDVVDDSDTRRGHDSVRGRWGNPAAVLCGDYYLSQVMQLLCEIDDRETSVIVNNTVRDMCQGELRQLALRHDNGRTAVETYLDIIGCKTAALMAACCELGARNFSTSQNPEQQWLREFGYHYGIVYQIRDDINDGGDDLPEGIDAEALIAKHAALAHAALDPLPGSDAKQVLTALLRPEAPQPR